MQLNAIFSMYASGYHFSIACKRIPSPTNGYPFLLNANGYPFSIVYKCPWCNGYRRRNWTRRHEFKSWTDCISHSTNTLGKGVNPIILPPAMGK